MNRIKAVFDKSAWGLILPAILFLFAVDSSMARTLLEWTSYALVLSGIAAIISRVIFPQIEIDAMMRRVKVGDRAAALVVSAVVFFVGIVFLALVIWAKT